MHNFSYQSSNVVKFSFEVEAWSDLSLEGLFWWNEGEQIKAKLRSFRFAFDGFEGSESVMMAKKIEIMSWNIKLMLWTTL